MKGKERKGKERKGKERKGKERKGKERKGKERKGQERKGKEMKGKQIECDTSTQISSHSHESSAKGHRRHLHDCDGVLKRRVNAAGAHADKYVQYGFSAACRR
jgi:hypothetical protein